MNMKERYEELDRAYPLPDTSVTKCEFILKYNLKMLREKLNLSRAQLVQDMRVEKSYYYKLEQMDYHLNPPQEWLDIIADYYGIEVYHLYMPDLEKMIKEAE